MPLYDTSEMNKARETKPKKLISEYQFWVHVLPLLLALVTCLIAFLTGSVDLVAAFMMGCMLISIIIFNKFHSISSVVIFGIIYIVSSFIASYLIVFILI